MCLEIEKCSSSLVSNTFFLFVFCCRLWSITIYVRTTPSLASFCYIQIFNKSKRTRNVCDRDKQLQKHPKFLQLFCSHLALAPAFPNPLQTKSNSMEYKNSTCIGINSSSLPFLFCLVALLSILHSIRRINPSLCYVHRLNITLFPFQFAYSCDI